MDEKDAGALARTLMMKFIRRTGLAPTQPAPRRYLWTDAFAVCNLLELYRRTAKERYRELAIDLVDQVHGVLARHRPDDPRTGWISGLDEKEGAAHPTVGGLRIGKPLGERQPDEPFDQNLEWERDGQYYHYLTKWMHALLRVARVTGEARYQRWALELAQTAHERFLVASANGARGINWKMSIDLSRPQVPALGQHDPFDGLVTFCELQAAAREQGLPEALDGPIGELASLCNPKGLATDDPLGIGGLLFDACRMMSLIKRQAFFAPELLVPTLQAIGSGLEAFVVRTPERLPAEYRLAFRELGLAIGLHGLEFMRALAAGHPRAFADEVPALIEPLLQYVSLAQRLEEFWADEANRAGSGWLAHEDINAVMLATSLAPQSFLLID